MSNSLLREAECLVLWFNLPSAGEQACDPIPWPFMPVPHMFSSFYPECSLVPMRAAPSLHEHFKILPPERAISRTPHLRSTSIAPQCLSSSPTPTFTHLGCVGLVWFGLAWLGCSTRYWTQFYHLAMLLALTLDFLQSTALWMWAVWQQWCGQSYPNTTSSNLILNKYGELKEKQTKTVSYHPFIMARD
jgi:hypothetical protein